MAAEFPPEIAAGILPPGLKAGGESRNERPPPLPADLAEGERAVLQLIRVDDPVHIDALSEASGLPVQELTSLLLSLEMRELIRQRPGRCFVRKI